MNRGHVRGETAERGGGDRHREGAGDSGEVEATTERREKERKKGKGKCKRCVLRWGQLVYQLPV